RLVAAGLRVGSRISIAPPCGPPTTSTGNGVEVAIAVGPACERWIALPPGRHTVGRAATAAVRIDDPAVELHHGVLDVDADGTVAFTQLTGVFPATIWGAPCGRAHPVDNALSIGSSRLLVGRDAADVGPTATGSVAPAERDPWRLVVRRGPAAAVGSPPAALEIPGPPTVHHSPPLTTLVGAGVAALGAGVLAAVLGQLLFAAFAAVGAVASLATWAVGAIIVRRDRRRTAVEHRRAVVEFERALDRARSGAERDHHARHRGVVDALDRIHRDAADVWSRRCDRDEALWATVGRGTSHWVPPIAVDDRSRLDAELLVAIEGCERLDDVAVPLALEASSTIAVHGSTAVAESLCRSIIVQLAADYGPADWELQVVAADPGRWSWVSWLPHTGHRPCLVAADEAEALTQAMERGADDDARHRRTVIVVDAPALLSARTSALRRRLDRGGVTCIAIVAADISVPAIVDRVLEVGDTGAARWIETSGAAWTALDRDIVVAGISETTAEDAARRLAPLLDPEDDGGTRAVPPRVALAELEPIGDDTATVIARRWKQGGHDPAPVACLGVSADGVVDIDLARDGPHGLIAGTTGSGKSELLRTLVVSLAARSSPDHVTMILVDYKGGSTFDACARLPHTVGVVTDLDDGLAARMLVSLDAEVRRRERLLRAAGSDDLAAYRRAAAEPLPRLVVVIDEFASLARELPDFLGALVSIAQRGRSLGVHLVLATQRPAGVVTDDIRANTNLRIALRLQDRADAHDVVGDALPAGFPPGTAGRAVLRLGPDELIVFQVADSSSPVFPAPTRLTVERVAVGASGASSETRGTAQPSSQPTALERLVDAIGHAATMVGTATPHRPWVDALPAVIRPRDLGGDDTAVGLLDDPAGQCRRPLGWQPDEGTLLLGGAVGSGTTTAASTVVAQCVRAADPDAMHLYVIDAQGATVWSAFEASAHCGAVVRLAETERVSRLMARLAEELDRRSSGASCEPVVVVVIDGYAAVRDALGDVDHGGAARRLDRLLRDGPVVGMVAVVTTDGVSSAGLAVPRAATWRFEAGVPGRMRVVESGLEGQIVFDPDAARHLASVDPAASTTTTAGRAAPVLVLPDVVDADEFDAQVVVCPSERSTARPVELPIGLGADDLEPSWLRVPVGDHVFIGGAARTGRSTALRQVEFAWRRAHPGGAVIRVDRHRPIEVALDALDALGSILVVVDDAERVDDPGGALTRLLAQPGVTFAVAARLEAVRVAYGHWTREVARGRCGLIMASVGEVDGELLGATLPRRSMIPPRPGLAWIVDHGGQRLVQVAARLSP
ncbi:MAG TPA: FtsK/SpoIIIE domain-containing protein, partial [Ilumatobacteraceae bacterium]|nr:FtsK/SpoIIIE domain-containing protein [Ilumatobacteraceae bacterium]